MERREFTIEPYVAASGIMGDQIVVDEKAADFIMRRTALRRDFQVAKGYARESREVEGDEVLTISTARVHNERQVKEVGERGISTLVKQGDVWVQLMHDQEIDDRINDWGKEHFKSHQGKTWQEVYSEEFVKRMRGEVVDGLQDAIWDEKWGIFSYPFKNSKVSLVMLVVGSGVFLETMRFLYKHNVFTGTRANDIEATEYLLLIASIGVLFLAATGQLIERLNNPRERGIVGTWSQDIPNPQIPSIILGNASLLLNSHKLIKLKQK